MPKTLRCSSSLGVSPPSRLQSGVTLGFPPLLDPSNPGRPGLQSWPSSLAARSQEGSAKAAGVPPQRISS
eukprot:1110558-Pyramimonas_sp.AAC.1